MTDWRPIPGFRTYEVSSDGRVRNTETGRELTIRRGRRGRSAHVTLTDNSGARREMRIRALLPATKEGNSDG